MTEKINKAMILAAGFGARLRPITCETPKPLVEVGGKKLIEYNIYLLKKSGIKEILINLHHLGEKIKNYLGGGGGHGVRITYSEEATILGTGGGVKKASSFFGREPFVVVNGDVITDVDIKDLVRHHLKNGFSVTLVLKQLEDCEAYTPIEVEDERVAGFGKGDMMYTGVQVIHPAVLDLLDEDVFSDVVKDVWLPLLSSGGKIGAYIHDGFWTEIGNVNKLEEVREMFNAGAVKLWYL